MSLSNLMYMTYLQEFRGLDLSKPFIVKIPGTAFFILNMTASIYLLTFSFSEICLSCCMLSAVTCMRKLILWQAWVGMGLFFMHQIYLEVQFPRLFHLISGLLDF